MTARRNPPRHRELARRPCAGGCGQIVIVTTRNRMQRFCSAKCAGPLKSILSAEARARAVEKHRRQRFAAAIRAATCGERIRESDLLKICARVYRDGYYAGYQVGSSGGHATRVGD